MISWFNGWAQSIILAVIIVTILEMILPEGKNKKYIKIVMGVYVTFTIVSPIISKVAGNDFEIDISKYEDILNANAIESTNSIESINNQSIESLYLNTIKTDIKSEIEKEGYQTKDIKITADINVEEEEAQIHKIDIEVLKKEKENQIKKVNKIEIGNTTEEVDENTNLTSKEINNLKKILSDKYEVEEEKIYINGK